MDSIQFGEAMNQHVDRARRATDASETIWQQAGAWERDNPRPCLAVDKQMRHLFAPCVAYEDGVYRMWFCGSQGSVEQRVFTMRLMTSADGVHFEGDPHESIFRMAGSAQSVLAPTLLRHPDGSVCRENGRLRMWFASCDFPSNNPLHTLHETSSADGVHWQAASETQLQDIYAPTILKMRGRYMMWYTDVSQDPWSFRHATSDDGRQWTLHPRPCMVIDQPWEHSRLFYPTVLHIDGRFHMWYGSYTNAPGENDMTALGLARSEDGIHWEKHPDNPVFAPDASRPWESHYTTSQSILKLPEGGYRIWYASRSKPPFDSKYYAICTARWPRS
jgi:hypothetical protein